MVKNVDEEIELLQSNQPKLSKAGSAEKARLSTLQKTKRKQEQHQAAVATVQALFNTNEEPSLRVWLHHFDKNSDLEISFSEFCEGLSKFNFEGDANSLFAHLDLDGSRTLSLSEIDQEASKLWIKFRIWCVSQFNDVQDFIQQLGREKRIFVPSARKLGWTGEMEDVIFDCMDADKDGTLGGSELKWFAADKKRHNRKIKARKKALKEQERHSKERRDIATALHSFRSFLKQKYVTYLRAWRCALDLDGSMGIQKHELFKAVKDMDWTGDARLLWKGLDSDNSGVTSLQELDLCTAVRLAKFKQFMDSKFGNSSLAFRALDVHNKGKLKLEEFLEACKSNGFRGTKALFHGLDWKGIRSISDRDIAFLDAWRCPVRLTCEANEQSALAFKAALIHKYSNYMKAWRVCLDRDNSNCVAWEEFEHAAKQLNFDGDIPGAWRFFDADLSGAITLEEIDPASSKALSSFKAWAEEEFGTVRSAFNVLDADGSGKMTWQEWRKACTVYGYEEDSRDVFDALDVDNTKMLTLNEVAFIDEWTSLDSPELQKRRSTVESLANGNASAMQPSGKLLGATAPARLSNRMEEIAQPRYRRCKAKPSTARTLTTLGDSLGTLPPGGETSWFLKPKQSPYMPSSAHRTEFNRPSGKSLQVSDSARSLANVMPPKLLATWPFSSQSTSSSAMIQRMRDEILQQPPIKEKLSFGEEAGHDLNGVLLASIRNKTRALRNRTVELVGKSDFSDRQINEGLWDDPSSPRALLGLLPAHPAPFYK